MRALETLKRQPKEVLNALLTIEKAEYEHLKDDLVSDINLHAAAIYIKSRINYLERLKSNNFNVDNQS
jgi:hypothetical protein